MILIEFLHTLGVGVLIFNILPHFDAFRGNIVLLNVAIVPSILKFLMQLKNFKCVPGRKFVYLIMAFVAVTSQVGGAASAYMYTITKDVIHTDDEGIFKLRIMYLAAVFLISLEWWENFISGRMERLKRIDFDSLRRHLEKTRMKASTILILVKLVTIVCFALFIARSNLLGIVKLNAVKPVIIGNTTVDPLQRNTTITPPAILAYNLENFHVKVITNMSTNETEEIITFVHQSKNYTCVTEYQNSSLILSCNVNETVIKLVCDNDTMICSYKTLVSGKVTDSDILNAHYVVLEDTADSVTFTNHTNNVTCLIQKEPNNMLRLFCKNHGIDLQLLCKSGYKECTRIYQEKDPSLITRIISFWEDNYVVMCTLMLSIIFTYCCVLACKLHMQQFSFSLSVMFISPLTSGMIYINCSGILTFGGIIPDVMSCAPMDFVSIKIWVIQAGILWLGLLLLTSYIWIPRYERMAKVERYCTSYVESFTRQF